MQSPYLLLFDHAPAYWCLIFVLLAGANGRASGHKKAPLTGAYSLFEEMILVVLSRRSSKLFELLELRERCSKDRRVRSESPVPAAVRQQRLSDTQLHDLLTSYVSGVGTIELAARFGVHRDAVRRHLNRAGVLRPREALSPAQIQRARALRASGMLYRVIGEVLGVSTETARKAVIKP